MADSVNSNINGNGNWQLSDGQWQSNDGSTLSSAILYGGGNPTTGTNTSGGGNLFAGGGSGGGNPFAGGTSNSDSNYQYERSLDERSLTDGNNPFNQLIGVIGGDSASSGSGNPLASGNPSSGGGNPSSGGNPLAAGGENVPGNLPFGSTPPSAETASSLPETGNGLPVPYNSDNWILDIQSIDGADATGNTINGNGNWSSGSNNTVDGNGNWNFSDGNTTNGNGNWLYSSGGTIEGNGNWNFGSGNTTNGNGNWGLGNDNDITGNANRPTGSNNDILGSGNTADVSGSSLLGNRIEASGDGKTLIGNEGWNFSTDSLISLGSSTPGSAIGTDVQTLLSSPDLVASAMSNPGYNNPDYDFSSLV